MTTKIKPYVYTSTVGVGDQIDPSRFTEDADIRIVSATRQVNDNYANGYGNSKWAGEVLLRKANDIYGLPVSVFRCDMILAEPRYAGQLNVPDMFTRLLLSLVATGIAPGSFYELDAAGNRQRAHYDGLPVDFIAEAISILGAHQAHGFETYHVMNPVRRRNRARRIRRLAGRSRLSDRPGRGLRGMAAAIRDEHAGPSGQAASGLAAAAAAQLRAARQAATRFVRHDRAIPRRGAGGESRPG